MVRDYRIKKMIGSIQNIIKPFVKVWNEGRISKMTNQNLEPINRIEFIYLAPILKATGNCQKKKIITKIKKKHFTVISCLLKQPSTIFTHTNTYHFVHSNSVFIPEANLLKGKKREVCVQKYSNFKSMKSISQCMTMQPTS